MVSHILVIVNFPLYRYSVTFRAENGGYRTLNNLGKQYYTGRTSTRRIYLKFDTETPYHCSEKNDCISSSSTIMTIQNDVTKVISKLSLRVHVWYLNTGYYSQYGMIKMLKYNELSICPIIIIVFLLSNFKSDVLFKKNTSTPTSLPLFPDKYIQTKQNKAK